VNDYVDSAKAAKQLNMTERHVCRMCRAGKFKGAVKSGGQWRIPLAADARLCGIKGPEDMLQSRELLDVPANKREDAIRKVGFIQAFEKFSAKFVKAGGTRSEAMSVFAKNNAVGKRSFQRWIVRYRNQGLVGLVDTRGGGKFISQMISTEAFELFKSMYLTPQQLSVKICWQNINYINRSENKGWKIPSLQFFYKYIKAQIPLFVEILHREGIAAYEAKCAPYVEKDPNSVAPGAVWIGDHSQLNLWIRHRGQWIRPWVTAWQDMRSRAIVGYYLTASPNQTTILLAMKRAIEKYGPPDSVKIDNGRDYDSEMWTGTTKAKRRAIKAGYIDEQMLAGIYAMMDIGASFAIAYHPQSKAIERFFDTLDCQFSKTFPTYCGKDTKRKPEYLKELLKSKKAIEQAYDLEGLNNLFVQYIDAYNNAAHHGKGMEGQSPLQVLNSRESRRVVADGVIDLLLRVWSGELVAGKNGVRFKNMWYGQYDIKLMNYQGKKVRIAYDPDDLRKVYVYNSATYELITIAEQNRLVQYGSAVNEEALRDAMRQKAKAVHLAKSYRDSRLTANMDLTTLTLKAMAEGRKETPPPAAANLRPVRTPFDKQVKLHKALELQKLVKKAAGAESVETVLDIDLSLMKPKQKPVKVKLFDD